MKLKIKISGFSRSITIPKVSGSQLLAEGYTKDVNGMQICGDMKYQLKQENSKVTITPKKTKQ